MATLRKLSPQLTLLLVCSALPTHARALEVSAVDQEGTPSQALVHSYERLQISIADQVAALQASFQFRNESDAQLELTCSFQLGQRELVDGFSYWNGKERIVGEVLERAAATVVYEELTGVRRDPGILEQEGDRFRFRVFPIEAHELKPVELTTVAPLAMRDGFIEYVIPSANLPTAGAGFELAADITDSMPIAEVQTVGFSGRVVREGPSRVRVRFETSNATLRQDLKIRYRLASPDYGMRLVTHHQPGDSEGSFMLIVSPKTDRAEHDVLGRDIVFVTDISGSMAGEPLEQSKAGLLEILTQLSPKDRFEVVSFDDESYPLFGQLVAATDQNLDRARVGVTELETRGGTNIHGALLRALTTLQSEQAGRPRAIVFLTDGQGNDPPEVVAADIREKASDVRIYSFGAGDGVNRVFLQRIAEDNRGSATFVQDQSQIADEMKRLYARIAMPLMLDLALDFGALPVSAVYPKRLPDLYRDNEVVVFGRYKPGAGTITLRGRLREGERTFKLTVKLPAEQPEHAYVEKLWATKRVDELLASAALRGEAHELVHEITRLGIVYDLVTPYTTFLAVPESVQTEEIKELMKQGKLGYDKKLIDTLEGIQLSQAAIPPGDPILTVDAPADAREVTAYFPFGLVKQLDYDDERGHWYVRFLVPRDVKDGRYTIRVRIADARGDVSWKDTEITIDGSEPELRIDLDEVAWAGEDLHVAVDPLEPVRDIYVTLPGATKTRVALKLNLESGLYEGKIKVPFLLPDGERLKVRVVARDRARNQVQEEVTLPVLFDGC